jgi:hypothetical protein
VTGTGPAAAPQVRRRDLRSRVATPDTSVHELAGEAPTLLAAGLPPRTAHHDLGEVAPTASGNRRQRRTEKARQRRRRLRMVVGAAGLTAAAVAGTLVAVDHGSDADADAVTTVAAPAAAGGGATTTPQIRSTVTGRAQRDRVRRAVTSRATTGTTTTSTTTAPSSTTSSRSSSPSSSTSTARVPRTAPPATSTSTPSGEDPAAGSTGVPAGTVLKVHEGDLTITKDGQHVDGLDVHGSILVKASDVLITNTRVRGVRGVTGKGLIHAVYGFQGLVVEDSTIIPAYPSVYSNGVKGGGFTLRRVEIAKTVDSVEVFGNNVKIVDSWLHDHIHYASDPQQNGGPSHNDGVQVLSGRNITVSGNTITGAANAAIQVTQDDGPVSSLTVTGNFLDNGTCTIKLTDKGAATVLGPVTVSGNRFGGNQTLSACGVLRTSRTSLTALANVWAGNGAAVTVKVDG